MAILSTLRFLREGLEYYAQVGDQRGQAKLPCNIGFAYEQLDDDEASLPYHFQALAIRESLEDHWGSARSLGSIAGAYFRPGRYLECEELYVRALEQAAPAPS